MVAVLSTSLLVLVAVISVSSQYSPQPQDLTAESRIVTEAETPISQRRKFTVKKLKILPVIKKPKAFSWLPSFLSGGAEEVTEGPTVHELAPLGQYPIWKVHKYKGIELRPVPVLDTPRAADLPVVRAEPPRVIQLPVYGPPVAEAYGAPLPPVQYPYPPALKENEEASVSEPTPAEDSAVKTEASDEDTQNSLDALSNLGTLTSFLGEGDANNLARLQFILRLFRTDQNLLTKLKNIKSWKFPTTTIPPPTNAIYYPPKKESKSILSSFIPNFFREQSSIPLPVLPEIEEIPVTGLDQVRIQLPELPPINLPAYTANHITGPYVRVKIGNPVPSANVDFKYPPLPIQEQQYTPVFQYQNFPTSYVGNTPLYNSYGAVIPYDSYSAGSDPEPAFVTPAPVSQVQQQTQQGKQQEQQQIAQIPKQQFQSHQAHPVSDNKEQVKKEVTPSEREQPMRSMEYDDSYDMQMEDNMETMEPRMQSMQ